VVTALIELPNNSPPRIELSTSTATVTEGVGRGTLVPGLNMIITDEDSVSMRSTYWLYYCALSLAAQCTVIGPVTKTESF